MVKWIKAAVIGIALLVSGVAFAQPAGSDGTLRFGTEQTIVEFDIEFARTATGTESTLGTYGLLAKIGPADGPGWGTATTSIASWTTPTKVVFSALDGNADDTLSCTGGEYIIEGIDQFGRPRREKGTGTLTESSVIRSKYAYSLLTRVQMRCTNQGGGGNFDSDNNDFLVVRADMRYVGLPRKISRKHDIISICLRANVGSPTYNQGSITYTLERADAQSCTKISDLTTLSATTLIDKEAQTIFMGGIGLGVDGTQGPETGDVVRIRYASTR